MFADACVDDHAIMRKRAASIMSRLLRSSDTLLSTLGVKLDSPLCRSLNGVPMVTTREVLKRKKRKRASPSGRTR
ncbi:jg2072 [Pararge aegeria aegeria]|uniref:Jg2072 protein n=1 Tax=Pararge aegeria aegeria TaxID=348720 RepID=A0A8S4QUI8_9NEOP|nr:jg2072 [Pararge aegeria aegeria]